MSALLIAGAVPSSAQQVPDLVTPDVLRVCADPAALPFSNRRGEGFENQVAAIVAEDLKVPLRTYWLAQGPGFVRNTLGLKLCDLIIGSAVGSELVQHTNPYYRSVYVLLVRHGELTAVSRLSDPALKDKRIGIVAGTPPGDHLATNGLTEQTIPYSPYRFGTDRRFDTPDAEIVADLVARRIDVAILWGPSAGPLARQSGGVLDLVPLVHEAPRPPMAFRIAMAVRPNENDWKRTLNAVLRREDPRIMRALMAAGVPLLDDDDRLIGPEPSAGAR